MNYFRYKQFSKDVITVAVGYYLRYALSYRDISEILTWCKRSSFNGLPLSSRICPNFVSALEEKA